MPHNPSLLPRRLIISQAAVQLRDYVEQAANKYPSIDYPGMHQKLHYLKTLFDIMEKDESVLLQVIDTDTFFQEVATAEQLLWEGEKCQQLQQYQQALEQYTTAWNTIQTALNGKKNITTTTKLLNGTLCHLYEKRAFIELELQLYTEALADIDALLEISGKDSSSANAHVLRATALEGMGNVEQAKKALAEAVLVNPQDEALRTQLEQLSVKEETQ